MTDAGEEPRHFTVADVEKILRPLVEAEMEKIVEDLYQPDPFLAALDKRIAANKADRARWGNPK